MSSFEDRNRWRVKVTGVSTDATVVELCNQFQVASHRINISKPQSHSSRSYAIIHGFDDEEEADTFISKWNDQFRRARINIKCEIDSNNNAMSLDDVPYPTQTGNNSKRHYPCRHGDKCYTADCPYQHSPQWRFYKPSAPSNDYDDSTAQSRTRKNPCRYGNDCRKIRSGCPYEHPDDERPVDRHPPRPANRHDDDNPRVLAQTSRLKSVETRFAERKSAPLPIFESYREFCERLRAKKLLIVVAETNSGKSTQLPQYAAESSSNGLVVCTQPRAMTTLAFARRVAYEYDGTSEGNSVGYQIGHRRDRVDGTKIMFMTDAALIYEYQMDSNLSEVRVLMIDEVQERSFNTDMVMGIAKLLLKKRSEDFHVVIVLSTVDPKPFLEFFDHSSTSRIRVENHVQSVAVEYLPPPKDCPERKLIELHVIRTLLNFYPKYAKHVLVFLPSQRDIEKALETFTKNLPNKCHAYALYESSSMEEQDQISNFDRNHPGERMVVFCTNFAETTFAIRNVQLVIDMGLVRKLRFDIQHRINVLETVRISRSSANRRRDIVAYSKRNCCIRLYNDEELKDDEIEPEISHSSLDLAILQLKNARLDPQIFPFFTKPDPTSVRASLDLLQNLLCLDEKGEITRRGQLFAELSINPRLSALMVDIYTEQKENQRLISLTTALVATLCAPGFLFSINDNRDRASPRNDDSDYNSDLLHLCTLFQDWTKIGTINRETKKCNTCQKSPRDSSSKCRSCRIHHAQMNGFNYQILRRIDNSIDFYRETMTNKRWNLTASEKISSKSMIDGEILGEYLRKFFPTQVGHLLVPHLPDEGVRLIESDLRASIANTSVYVQRAHDPAHQYFVAMFITRSTSGRYVVDRLHQVSAHGLPSSTIEKILVRENIGRLTSNDVRNTLGEVRSQTWAKWLIQEYDQISRQLTIWGLRADQSQVESALQPILTRTHAEVIECGSIRATFENGLICTKIEITENALRLNLQRVPCKTYNKLQSWLKAKLNISRHDIRENNFQEKSSKSSDDDDDDDEDDGYEAPPFYIVLKSTEAFQRATANLSAHYICPQETLAAATTGTHMSEKDAWGRQLVLTVPPGGTFITAKELLDRLTPHALDCRAFGKRSIRALPGIQLTNLARDTDELSIRQVLQPINPVKISLKQTHRDGTGSSSAHIFFANDQQRQQTIANLQGNFCQQPVTITVRSRTTHQLVQKQIMPTVTELKGTDPIPLTFLITAINRQSAHDLHKDIIPKMDSSWQIDSSATVTVTHPHLYPDFDALLQKIADQFKTQVQQQPIDQKQINGRSPIRCFFNHGAPQKTAQAAMMLAQATAPIIIKLTDERQKQLFNELFSTGEIQNWSDELKLESIKKERVVSWVEIRGPQVQQGQLMRRIGDYSDTFDKRFRVIELNSTTANFFGRRKQADHQLQNLTDNFSNWGCSLKYVPKTKSIVMCAEPTAKLSLLDSCEGEVKQLLKKLAGDASVTRDQQKCVFCGKMSYSSNTLRLCGHPYCRCASSHLTSSIPLQCPVSTCKSNISMEDVLEIFPEREELIPVCKQSIQIYLEKNSSTFDQRCCPNSACDGLVKQSNGYQTCLTCGRNVCTSCTLIDDDSHQGRTCAERIMFQNMGEFLPSLYKAAEKFARDNWAPATPPIIRIDYNLALAEPCASMKRFYKGIEALGQSLPPDMARGFFAFHGTAAVAIKPICGDGFDPKRRSGQACGPGEYFGVTSAVSHGYCRPANPQGPFAMIIAFLLTCPQLSTRPGFCHVMNNPTDWSHAFNIPVVVVSYGTQASCESPLAK